MDLINVRVWEPSTPPPKEEQLTWRIAKLATESYGDTREVTEMVINRILDNAAVALAALNRPPVATARAQALAHPRANGATVIGLPTHIKVECGWSAWANGVAVRELDFHDTYMAAEVSHPGDNIPAIIAVAQQCGLLGTDVVRGIATAYQTQISLSEVIALNPYHIDHVAHLGPAIAAGICAALRLDIKVTYQAINHAAHVSTATRQGRKGNISS